MEKFEETRTTPNEVKDRLRLFGVPKYCQLVADSSVYRVMQIFLIFRNYNHEVDLETSILPVHWHSEKRTQKPNTGRLR